MEIKIAIFTFTISGKHFGGKQSWNIHIFVKNSKNRTKKNIFWKKFFWLHLRNWILFCVIKKKKNWRRSIFLCNSSRTSVRILISQRKVLSKLRSLRPERIILILLQIVKSTKKVDAKSAKKRSILVPVKLFFSSKIKLSFYQDHSFFLVGSKVSLSNLFLSISIS